ncbi:MAG: hypothetical protein GC191_19620 [Azospirillum sp.]|nr:hypothetical protein [Azospirillum sp.]
MIDPVSGGSGEGTAGKLRLNLGCGLRREPGFLNVDKFGECEPDLVWDLERLPWPWPDNSAVEIRLIHVLEHLGRTTESFFGIMKELYRVCAGGATVVIHVPHFRHDDFFNDPTHVRVITPTMLGLFDRDQNLDLQARGGANSPLALYTGTHFKMASALTIVDKRWKDRVDRGEISWDQLRDAYEKFNNVAAEFHMVLSVVKPS